MNESKALEALSNTFYDKLLVFDPIIINNILENLALYNKELNNPLLDSVINNVLKVDKEQILPQITSHTYQQIALIQESSIIPDQLNIDLSAMKIPMDLANPLKLPESQDLQDILLVLIQDIQVSVSIMQNAVGIYDLPLLLLRKIIFNAIKNNHVDTNYWFDFNNCGSDVREFIIPFILEIIERDYLLIPHLNRLQVSIYTEMIYCFGHLLPDSECLSTI